MSPERRGLIAYLGSDQVKPATRIDGKGKREDGKKYGTLSVPFETGSVYLASAERGDFRVVWNGGGVREVPVGRYRATHYQVEITKDGIDWLLSGKSDKPVEIADGKETRLDLDVRVHLAFSLKITHHGALVQLMITGDGAGLSIIRNGRLVDLRYQLLDGDRRELSAGPMKYG